MFTLFERTTLSPVYYLFEFIKKGTLVSVFCVAEDVSTSTNRSNEFIIKDTASPNPLLGEINLEPGEYIYKIYEQSSPTNLNPSGLNIVECERLTVKPYEVVPTEYTNNDLTNVEYSG